MGNNDAMVHYSKEQHLQAARYTLAQRDILTAILEEGKLYTQAEAEGAMQAYLKRSVK